MSTKTETKVKPFEAKYVKITDPELIAKYDKMDLYIPPHETPKTMDQAMLEKNRLGKSVSRVGQIRPIEVTVWEKDPEKDSTVSHNRVHLRVMNGRHRYVGDKAWSREYYDLQPIADSGYSPSLAYYQIRQHHDLQKTQTPDEQVMLLEEMGEVIIKTIPIPNDEVCNELVKLLVPQGLMSESSILRHCPQKFKNKKQADSRKGKTFEATGKDTKQKIEVKKEASKMAKDKVTELVAEKNTLLTNLTKMESEKIGVQRELTKQLKVTDEIEAKLRVLSIVEDVIECKCGNKIPVKVDGTSNKILVKA